MFHKWTISIAVVEKFPGYLIKESTFKKVYKKSMLNKKKLHKKRYELKYKVTS